MKNTCTALFATVVACGSALLSGAEVRQVDLKPFSQEGRLERIQIRLDGPVDEPLFLDVYEFHPIMRPDLAPPQDRWNHERQMEHMRLVQAGVRPVYRPDGRDAKVQEILREIQPRSYPMQALDDGDLAAVWKAAHGRIFFRFRIGEKALEPIYSMRVHCRHSDLRNVERLKQALQGLQLPLRHHNPEMAAAMFSMTDEIYRRGHGLRYMMTHHEEDVSGLDGFAQQLEADIADARWQAALASLERFGDQVQRAEQLFRTAEIRRDGPGVQVSLADRTGFAYGQDPETEVYVREARSQPPVGHPHPMPGSQHDHGAAPDRAWLTAGAVRLQLVQLGTVPIFAGTVPEEWERLEVVVLYGEGQRYFWTQTAR